MAFNSTTTDLMKDSLNAGVDGSVIEAKVLSILRTAALGVYASASAQNPQTIAGGGSALFRVPELVQAFDYVVANRDDVPDNTVVDTIELPLDIKRVVKYELETMDSANFSNAGEIEGVIAAGASTAIIADLDAFFLDTARLAAIANTVNPFVINPNYSTADDDTEINKMYFDTVDLVGNMEGTVSKKYVGINKPEVLAIVNTKAGARFIKSAGGGNTADRVFTGEVREINGINLFFHPLIGKNIAAGDSWTKDKAYDWSLVENLTLHTEAIAMPFTLNSVVQTQGENSGNPKFIFKYKFGVQAIRPELVAGIFNADPTVFLLKNTKIKRLGANGKVTPEYKKFIKDYVIKQMHNLKNKPQIKSK